MKREVNDAEIKNYNCAAIIYTILLAAFIIFAVPSIKWFGLYGVIPNAMLFGCAMFYALKLERFKSTNNIHTYKEIVAFSEGRMLDQIEQKIETGKRPYQYILLALSSGFLVALVCMLLYWLQF